MNIEEWKNFKGDTWKNEINVKDFIVNNYDKYDGNESFLAGVSNKTSKVWSKCEELLKKELGCHVLDIDTDHMSGINAFKPGYICPEDDVIVGLQTDAPLKRIVNPTREPAFDFANPALTTISQARIPKNLFIFPPG